MYAIPPLLVTTGIKSECSMLQTAFPMEMLAAWKG